MPKLPVPRAKVTAHGVDGDWQRNRKYHGGPNRAVCIYSEELYAWLCEKGIDLKNGSVGENFTTSRGGAQRRRDRPRRLGRIGPGRQAPPRHEVRRRRLPQP